MKLSLSPANGLSSWFILHHRKKEREHRESMRKMNIPQLTDPMHACLFGILVAGKSICIKHLDSFFVDNTEYHDRDLHIVIQNTGFDDVIVENVKCIPHTCSKDPLAKASVISALSFLLSSSSRLFASL